MGDGVGIRWSDGLRFHPLLCHADLIRCPHVRMAWHGRENAGELLPSSCRGKLGLFVARAGCPHVHYLSEAKLFGPAFFISIILGSAESDLH
jgi:hypothetical protein